MENKSRKNQTGVGTMRLLASITAILFLLTGCSYKDIMGKKDIEKQETKKEELKKEPVKSSMEQIDRFDPQIRQFEMFSKGYFKPTRWENVPEFFEDDLTTALQVFQKDCKRSYRKVLLNDVCQKVDESTNAKEFFLSNFYPYTLLSKDGKEEGLITGYYEPILNGNWTKTEKFKYGVYKTPSNLITVDIKEFPKLKGMRIRGKVVGNKLVRYTERKDMENEDLEAICYVDDKVDLFFMHIQGSGKVRMQDGEIINVNYASQNGRGYYAIGRKLIEKKYVSREDMSLKAIQKWLKDNPNKADDLLNLNKSYVFFKQSDQGATGALGSELVAHRNLAVDKRYIPLGLPVFIQTNNPQTDQPINNLTIAADVGGAIKGEIRADYYWGTGIKAGESAGKMKEKGKLVVLLPKGYIDAYNE